MVAFKRVAIGGTFACDEALSVPLQYLLANAVWNVDVDLQWLRYQSLTDFDEWSNVVLHPSHPLDLILFLIRIGDLEVAHPEQFRTKQDDDRATCNVDGSIDQLLNDLERYDSMTNTAPLVVLLCPCPPTAATRFNTMECKVQKKINCMQNVSVQTSKQLLALYRNQYTTSFYNAVTDKRQHSPYTQAMLNVISLSLCRQICRLFRPICNPYKVIVLDCDNTLWGGAIAEIGPNGIDLGPQFLSLQRFVVAQQQERGMLLALCSKNSLEDVLKAFTLRRNDMVLQLDKHVVATKINWQLKSENIVQLAKELNLGLDSFVFIDDNPLECSEVATALPSVTVISLGIKFRESVLDHEWVFDDCLSSSSCKATANTGTKEDGLRTHLIQQNFQRNQLRESFLTHNAFLSALDVKIVFEELDRDQELRERSLSFIRALQLHHRTNQFNTVTTFAKRLEEVELLKYVAALENTVICTHVTDRYGHYGLVSVALCRFVCDGNILRVDSFLLSCRALNRGVEHAVVRKLSEVAARTGAASLEVVWEPTDRNQPAHAFFSALSDVRFVVNTNNHPKVFMKEKQQLSLFNDGSWIIEVNRGSRVYFLETESFEQRSVRENVSKGWIFHLGYSLPLLKGACSVIWRMLSSNLLPQWLTRLLTPFRVQLLDEGPTGTLRVPLRNRGSLERFVSRALSNAKNTMVTEMGNTDFNGDKFRRKARHQTKLTLINYLHSDASRMIWSANRQHAHDQPFFGNDINVESVTGDETMPAIRLQPICNSPHCFATVQRECGCTLQRCRICCYRVQRLLIRSMHHANAKARQSAVNALQTEFASNAYVGAAKEGIPASLDTQWCAAHQDKRRLGEMFNKRFDKKTRA